MKGFAQALRPSEFLKPGSNSIVPAEGGGRL
jgi:hypothetical protein